MKYEVTFIDGKPFGKMLNPAGDRPIYDGSISHELFEMTIQGWEQIESSLKVLPFGVPYIAYKSDGTGVDMYFGMRFKADILGGYLVNLKVI